MYRNHDWNDDYSYNSYSYSYSSSGRNKLSDNKKVNVNQYCNNCGKFGHLFSNCIVLSNIRLLI